MTQALANGNRILAGTITMPRIGAWRADLDVDLSDATKLTGAVTVTIGDLEWRGTSVEVGPFVGHVKARLVGGAGGLRKPTQSKFYQAIPARVVAQDVLAEGGEVLSSAADAALLGAILPLWTRPGAVVIEGLEQLVDELGVSWRMLPDGTVWIGKESWPDAKVDLVVMNDEPHEARVELAGDEPNLFPGTAFLGRRVTEVEIRISPGETRIDAWFESEDARTSGDVLRVAVNGIVRDATRQYDFYAVRGGKVVSQNGDGTLELKLDDPAMPGLSRVPIAYGIPGISATVAAGGRVHVEFEGGSPAKPRAVVIDSMALKSVTLKASQKVVIDAPDIESQKGGRPLARLGDMVQVISTPPGTPAIGQIITANQLHRG